MQEFRAGYTVARHVVTVAEARGYVTAPNALLVLASGAAHWFERLEDVVAETRRAHEGLLRAGDPHMTAYCRNVLGILLVDGAPTLTDLITEVEAGIAYADRTGNIHVIDMLVPIRQLARALRGETEAPDSFTDESFDEPAFVPGLAANPPAALVFHAMHGIAEIICGQMSRLAANAAAAAALLPGSPGLYSGAIAQLVRGLSLAEQVRAGGADEHVTADLAACHGWLTARAADAPANFAHVAQLVGAEQAWALGDRWAAAHAFDAAIRTAETAKRPWHRALIYERAALFHTAHGLDHTGRMLMAEARRAYELWGATAKVRHIDACHPDLPGAAIEHGADHRRSISISTDTIDLLAVLDASQALSSETNLDRLRARVTESLGAMTGATDVRLLLHHADADDWHLPAETGDDIPLAQAGARGLVPLSVVRYVERMREPLAIDDATRDDRFRRDPHLAGLEQCSLLAMPIFAHGSARAMLLLENRLSRGAFTAERLSTVTLIAGQLAVSLDNAMVYASLEHKVAERTEALAIANARLERLAVTDTLTGLANRRRLAEILDAEWRRAVRYRTTLAVAMIDVDHFKGYNDHYGHGGGDECLRRVATSLAESVRNTDYVARYGGEEFVIVLPETDLAGTLIVAERVRAAVETLAEPHAAAPRGIVTVSIGIAAVEPSVGQSVDDLVKTADVQLYDAKHKGRNRVAGG
jgi:diguanylate cyclase (GGDEF)-like protein